jgi:[CysO sulfur-carrier protein]-S-L-cysteine hydrolase
MTASILHGLFGIACDKVDSWRNKAATVRIVLQLTGRAYVEMIAHAYDGLPMEACGLIVGTPGLASNSTAKCIRFVATANDANSSKVYTIPPKAHLRAELAAEDDGLEIIGVMHSHTHTTAYPSPTDVTQAPDPGWHYVIVSLRDDAPVLRSYRIVDGAIAEEPVTVTS